MQNENFQNLGGGSNGMRVFILTSQKSAREEGKINPGRGGGGNYSINNLSKYVFKLISVVSNYMYIQTDIYLTYTYHIHV